MLNDRGYELLAALVRARFTAGERDCIEAWKRLFQNGNWDDLAGCRDWHLIANQGDQALRDAGLTVTDAATEPEVTKHQHQHLLWAIGNALDHGQTPAGFISRLADELIQLEQDKEAVHLGRMIAIEFDGRDLPDID